MFIVTNPVFISFDRLDLTTKVDPIPYLEPSFFPLDINIESRMSPGIKLVVYYIREDGEIVADSIKLDVSQSNFFFRPFVTTSPNLGYLVVFKLHFLPSFCFLKNAF